MRKKCRSIWVEWITFTLVFFFLYDIIWALADPREFFTTIKEECVWFAVDLVCCGIFSLASLSLNHRLFRLWRFAHEEQGYKYFVYNGIVILISNLLIAAGFELLIYMLFPTVLNEDLWGNSYIIGLIASLTAVIHLAIHYSNMVIQKGKENIALQKRYLKLQLDPHFVFNSLSSLAGMIDTEPQLAEQYVVKLSRVYRQILRHIDDDFISLAEAVEFAHTYVELLNMRYQDKITLQADISRGGNDEFVLSMSLQLLIENAVKHNTPRGNSRLHIHIDRQNNMLVIRNNRICAHGVEDKNVNSSGIGLNNLRKRYELQCGVKPEIILTETSFEVQLPIIRK